MSSQPSPVTAATAPYVPTTTPTIERANRLISVRAHPGFLDIVRMSQEIVQSAVDQCMDYPGWDEKQMMVLTIRQKCAKELRQLLFDKINDAIADGIAEAKAQTTESTMPTKTAEQTAEQAVDQSDYVRMKMLERFDENDMRAAGSY